MNNDDFNKKFDGMSFSTSWTQQTYNVQPYSNWNQPISSINSQLAVIEAIDNIVQHMAVYPDAEKLLEDIRIK